MFPRIMILAMLLAAACTPNPVQSAPPPQDVPEQTTPVPSPIAVEETDGSSVAALTPASKIEDEVQKKLTQIVVNDLATQLNVNAEKISVTSAHSAVWPDAALGCPLLNKAYTQGKVHGFRIWLKVNGQVYEYHTDRTGKIVLCVEPEVKPQEPGLR